nr:hypothetical protein [Haloterrigena gelatinilytica]
MSAIEGSVLLVGLVTDDGLVLAFTSSTITLIVVSLVTEPPESVASWVTQRRRKATARITGSDR